MLQSVLRPPWCLAIRDEAPLTVLTVVRGHAWVGDSTQLGEGDVALVRGPGHYDVADDPSTAPTVVVNPGQVCTSVAGEPVAMRGVRTWGHAPDVDDDATWLLTGTYERPSDVSDRLLRALPTVAVLRADEWRSPLTALLAEEVTRDEPGQVAVLDRLLDLLLIAALRAWFARPDADAPGWYRARSDPLVGAALGLMESQPSAPWTLASLARATNVSRATLARRFTELVGEPPMRFLTRWRLDRAADLMRRGDLTLAAIADEVGYSSAFALSAAFKRERGVSPREHRALAAAASQA